MTSAVETLPTELLEMVVQHLNYKTDLKSLCLTSKFVRAVATPWLYQTVALDLTKLRELPGYFTKSNPGFKHTKALHCWLGPTFDPQGQYMSGSSYVNKDDLQAREYTNETEREKIARNMMRAALACIPNDVLRTIILPVQVNLDRVFREALCSRQHNLCFVSLGYGLLGLEGRRSTDFLQLHNLVSLRVTDIETATGDSLELSRMLSRCRRPRCLKVTGMSVCDVETIYDGAVGADPALNGHIEHPQDPKPSEPLSIPNLWLDNPYSIEPTILQTVDFSKLSNLALENCRTADDLLKALTNAYRSRRTGGLRGFYLVAEYDEVSLDVVKDFLRSFTGLECLRLDVQGVTETVDVHTICHHSKTLRRLQAVFCYNQYGREPIDFDLDALRSLLRQCTHLTQLALTLPGLLLPTPSSGRPQWADHMGVIKAARNIRYLRVMNWPKADGHRLVRAAQADQRKLYLYSLDSLATTLFQDFNAPDEGAPRTELLVIGSDCSYQGPRPLGQFTKWHDILPSCYHIRANSDQRSALVSPIPRSQVQYIDDAYDMFTQPGGLSDNGIGLGGYGWDA